MATRTKADIDQEQRIQCFENHIVDAISAASAELNGKLIHEELLDGDRERAATMARLHAQGLQASPLIYPVPIPCESGKNAPMQQPQPDDATEHVQQMHQKLVEEEERERDEPAREEAIRELVERWGPTYQQ
jgi:hypothetical protein